MHTIMAILNQKGGVGKTTTAVTLASGLARNGYRVLLVDLDTQGNVADSLGLPHGDDLRRLLSPDLRCPLDQAITPSGSGASGCDPLRQEHHRFEANAGRCDPARIYPGGCPRKRVL